MEILSVKSSGSEELLSYCITKGVNLQRNATFAGLINDDMQYRFILNDINLFELFQLTQTYRTELKVHEEHQFQEPEENYLQYYLGESKQSSAIIEKFIHLTNQMFVDKDIIDESVVSLFLPMITRRYKISIPISFEEIIHTLTDEEYLRIYNTDYPSSLERLPSFMSIKTKLASLLSRLSEPIAYTDKQYKVLKSLYYAKLKTRDENDMYRFGLLKFGKVDTVTGIKSFYHPSSIKKEEVKERLKLLPSMRSPMEMEFVIQIPIYHMQILLNIFGNDILQVAYPSSIKSIIENGMNFKNIKSIVFKNEKENLLSEYSLRITECNQLLLEMISQLIKNSGGEYETVIFSLLPSLYMTNAVIRVNENDLDQMVENPSNRLLWELFTQLKGISNKILSDICFL